MKNWKTSVVGFAGAVIFAISNQPDWKHLLMAVLIATAGLVAKDSNVTGGTVPQAGGTVPADPAAAAKAAK